MIGLRKFMVAAAILTLIPSGIVDLATAQPMPGMRSRQAAPGGANLMQKIQAELGTPLSLEQKQQMVGVIQSSKQETIGAQQSFVREVSSITGVSPTQILPMMPQIGKANNVVRQDLVQQLEAILGKSLTSEQLEQIQQADRQKKDTILATQESLASQLSQITGLSVEAIAGMLPQVRR